MIRKVAVTEMCYSVEWYNCKKKYYTEIIFSNDDGKLLELNHKQKGKRNLPTGNSDTF